VSHAVPGQAFARAASDGTSPTQIDLKEVATLVERGKKPRPVSLIDAS
jgi:hypothetical protein